VSVMMVWDEEEHLMEIARHLELLMAEEEAGLLLKTPMIQKRSVGAVNFNLKSMEASILFKHSRGLEEEFNLSIQSVLNQVLEEVLYGFKLAL
jgi:hypothetical protein